MTAIDTSWLLGKVRGQARPEIPDIPLDIVVQRGGPDPLVDMSRNLAARVGETVTVPVRLDNTEFLEAAELRIVFDPALDLIYPMKGPFLAEPIVRAEAAMVAELEVELAGLAGPEPST